MNITVMQGGAVAATKLAPQEDKSGLIRTNPEILDFASVLSAVPHHQLESVMDKEAVQDGFTQAIDIEGAQKSDLELSEDVIPITPVNTHPLETDKPRDLSSDQGRGLGSRSGEINSELQRPERVSDGIPAAYNTANSIQISHSSAYNITNNTPASAPLDAETGSEIVATRAVRAKTSMQATVRTIDHAQLSSQNGDLAALSTEPGLDTARRTLLQVTSNTLPSAVQVSGALQQLSFAGLALLPQKTGPVPQVGSPGAQLSEGSKTVAGSITLPSSATPMAGTDFAAMKVDKNAATLQAMDESGSANATVSLLSSSVLPEQLNWEPVRASASPGSTHRADMTPHIARQLVDVMPHATHRPVEIALSPEELGRVRMSVATEDGKITVNILAERPDTLDLMRRHIDQLGQTFRNMGYDQITFSFGQGAESGNNSGGGADSSPSSRPGASDEQQAETQIIQLDPTGATGIDIRL